MNRSSLIIIISLLVIRKQIQAENDSVSKTEAIKHVVSPEQFPETEFYTVSVKVILDDSTESILRKTSNYQSEKKSDERHSDRDIPVQIKGKNKQSRTVEDDRIVTNTTKPEDISSIRSSKHVEKVGNEHGVLTTEEIRRPKESFKIEKESYAAPSTSNPRNRLHSVFGQDFKEYHLEVDNIESSTRSMANTNVSANKNFKELGLKTHTSFVNNTKRYGTEINRPTENTKSALSSSEKTTSVFEKSTPPVIAAHVPLIDNKQRPFVNSDELMKGQTNVITSDTSFKQHKYSSYNITYDTRKHSINATDNIEKNIRQVITPDVIKINKNVNKPYEASYIGIRKGTEDRLKDTYKSDEQSKSSISNEKIYEEQDEVVYVETDYNVEYKDDKYGVLGRTDLSKYDENESDEDYDEEERFGFDDYTRNIPFDTYYDPSAHNNRRMLTHPTDILEIKGRTIEDTSEANKDFWTIPKENYHKFIPVDNIGSTRIEAKRPRKYKTYNKFINVPSSDGFSRLPSSAVLRQKQPYLTPRQRDFNIYRTKSKQSRPSVPSKEANFDNLKPVQKHFLPYPYIPSVSSVPFSISTPKPYTNQYLSQSNFQDVIYKLAVATEHPLIKTNYHFSGQQYTNPLTFDHKPNYHNLFNNNYNPFNLPRIYE